MTHTDYTKKILNIKDKNIYFEDDCRFLFGIPFYDKKLK